MYDPNRWRRDGYIDPNNTTAERSRIAVWNNSDNGVFLFFSFLSLCLNYRSMTSATKQRQKKIGPNKNHIKKEKKKRGETGSSGLTELDGDFLKCWHKLRPSSQQKLFYYWLGGLRLNFSPSRRLIRLTLIQFNYIFSPLFKISIKKKIGCIQFDDDSNCSHKRKHREDLKK